MTPEDMARQIERDRRRREDELLLLLLLLMGRVQRDVTTFLRHGQPFQTVLSNSILGRGAASTPGVGASSPPASGVTSLIADSMADAHRDAFRRLGKLTGEDITRDSAGPVDDLARQYVPQATDAAQAMAQRLYDAVNDRLAETPGANPTTVVREAFEAAGYTRGNPYAIYSGAERAIVMASNAGMLLAARGGVTDETGKQVRIVEAFRHISVLDDRTTAICTERNNLTLDSYDPFWLWNCPPLHFGCRSILQPLFNRDHAFSMRLPSIPPDEGFGIAPAGIF